MPGDAFLDTGVVLGFCFTLDKHHYRCKNYIDDRGGILFYSETVEGEYQNRRYGIIEELSSAILSHRSDIVQADYEGQLDQLDLKEIQGEHLYYNDDITTPLRDWYGDLPNFIMVDELTDRLRTLAQEIEKYSMQRKQSLEKDSEVWTPSDSVKEMYDDLWSTLDCIPGDDREICLEAHDITEERDINIEFATVNPSHFVDNGVDDLICAETGVCGVADLAKRG